MITASQSFRIYQILFKHFGNEEDSREVVQEIENVIDNKFDKEKEHLATKEDLWVLKGDISRLETKIAEAKSDVIKWMFVLWVTQMLAFIGLYLKTK